MARQSEKKYNRLMEKAEELFVELGYKAVSMEEIAEAAGISKMTIYKHFPSKEELFLEIIFKQIKHHYKIIDEEIKNVSGTIEKINFLVNYSLEISKNYSFALYKDIMTLPYITEKIIAEKNRLNTVIFENILKEGVEQGEVRKGDITFMADMLIMITEAFGRKYMCKIDSREELEATTTALFDFLKYGLFGK